MDTRSISLVETLFRRFGKVPAADSIWISCVCKDFAKTAMNRVCRALWGIRPDYIQASAHAAGVNNGYEPPASLGADRWAALVAARHLTGAKPTLIIDAGTAVTVDYLDGGGQFAGGVIFPGMATMIESLNARTGRIKGVRPPEHENQPRLANTNTRSAVENGVMLSIIAGVDQAVEHHPFAEDENFKIIITGGDAPWIARLSRHKMHAEPNLVLAGILLLSEAANR